MKVTHSTTIELKQLSWLWCIGIWLLKCTKSQVLGQERCNIITKWFTWSGSDAHLNSLLQRGVVNSEISRGLYFYYNFTSEKLIFICVRVCVCLKSAILFQGGNGNLFTKHWIIRRWDIIRNHFLLRNNNSLNLPFLEN